VALNVKRLRIWFATAGLLLIAVVAGFFLYARYRVHRAIEQVRKLPEKYGVEIQQTTKEFNFCKSDAGQTLFCIRAAKTIQFKGGNRAELQDVNITVYGRKADRFDQIYGKTFEYDPQSGVVTAAGEVQIDLEGNANAVAHPDQAAPAEMKNPIHLKTSGLSFNSKTGMAHTAERVEFRTPQAAGSAIGADYDSNANQLTLQSAVFIHATGQKSGDVNATHAVITKEPLLATLEHVRGTQPGAQFDADELKIYFRDDSTVEHAIASGHVNGTRESLGSKAGKTTFSAGTAEVFVTEQNTAKNAVLSGGAVVDATGERPMHAEASRVLVDFARGNEVKHVRGIDNVKLVQQPQQRSATAQARSARPDRTRTPGPAQASQTLELTAGAVDVDVRAGRFLQKAWTSGAAQIVTTQQQANASPTRTTITAARFDAAFDNKNRVKSLHGAPDAKMVSSAQGQPDRVTTSRDLDVEFNPNGSGIAAMTQNGDFHYVEGPRSATAEHARYTAADELFELTGNPRYSEASSPTLSAAGAAKPGAPAAEKSGPQSSSAMSLSANALKLNRRSGAIHADGDVKTTYAELKPQAQGAMLGSSNPIHVTAEHMSARRAPAQNQGASGTPPPPNANTSARYSGNARLWQEANLVAAPTIDFDRDKRTMVAQGNDQQRVSTVFVQQDKAGKVTPVNITAAQLAYGDTDRRARFTGGVVMKGQDATVTADKADVILAGKAVASQSPASTQSASNKSGGTPGATQSSPAPSQVQQIVADGHVVITEPSRKATGEKLVYTSAEQKFVLTGGPPVITDAEHGRITGQSLTFYSKDDRVLVEGSAATPLKSSK
jgi:lipopolysaccharide export system protein LptA